ncbi:MAG: hydrolase 1, exosortase A system-associated [Parahaliea sp.]
MKEIADVEVKALSFPCAGEQLMGIVHMPGSSYSQSIGLLCVVAGGPQYRAGVGRGMVAMGRQLAGAGIPVMRFDYRGMGDSSGAFRGFQWIQEDLEAAVAAFKAAVPALEGVVLWGGCDAASAIMIHAHHLPDVRAIALGNPWVSNETTQAVVARKHYLSRLREKSFWMKVFRFEYNPLDYGRSALTWFGRKFSSDTSNKDAQGSSGGNFIERMRLGLQRFDGPVLLVMSGASLFSREFDELARIDAAWGQVVKDRISERIVLPEADQTFSNEGARAEVNRILQNWLINGVKLKKVRK